MSVYHWFLPHKETHKKAEFISWHLLLVYVLIFMFLQVSFSILGYTNPGVLGTDSSVTKEEVIELTNKEREKLGLPALKESSSLDKAAEAKAANMFEENYWAHFAPSGKSPWDFILGSGYTFTYAGENLAKNFYTSEEAVKAWMNSPSHKENITNSKYEDIGIAVVDGNLNGQKTTLIVQMFGTTDYLAASNPSIDINGQKISLTAEEYQDKPLIQSPVFNIQGVGSALIDPYQTLKILGLAILAFIGILLVADYIVLKKRGVLQSRSNYIMHLTFMSGAAVGIFTSSPGTIL